MMSKGNMRLVSNVFYYYVIRHREVTLKMHGVLYRDVPCKQHIQGSDGPLLFELE